MFTHSSTDKVNTILQAIHEQTLPTPAEKFTPLEDQTPLENNINRYLLEIKKQLHRLEQNKYPKDRYTTALYESSQEEPIFYVQTKDATLPLTDDQLIQMKHYCLAIRKLSIISGIIAHLNSPSFLTKNTEQKAVLFKDLEKKTKDIIATLSITPTDDININKEMNLFIDELFKITVDNKIGNTKNKKDILDDIRNAERYFVADYMSSRILVNEIKINDQDLLQIDIPLDGSLTFEQRQQFADIHGLSKPLWFLAMKPWEQDWLKKNTPHPPVTEAQWDTLEKKFQSSAMQNIPGVKNARTTFLIDKKTSKIISCSIKTGTLVPYEMSGNTEKKQAELNASQMLINLEQQTKENFNRLWGDFLGDYEDQEVKPPIFFHSLLSDTVPLFSGKDTHLTRAQTHAIHEAIGARPELAGQVIVGNDPTNILRFAIGKSPLFHFLGRKERWDHVDHIVKCSQTFLANKKFKEYPALKTEQIPAMNENLKLLKALNEELMSLKAKPPQFAFIRRNKSAFKVAYADLLVETMGGVVSTNCKSGKDRTGLDEIYRNAIRAYFLREGKLPKYDDTGKDREKFIDIFVQFFNSMKIQEAAAANTPGSFGIKDSSRILCRDIATRLDESYKQSNQRAGLNKPKKLAKLEKIADKRIKRWFAQKEKKQLPLNPEATEKSSNHIK